MASAGDKNAGPRHGRRATTVAPTGGKRKAAKPSRAARRAASPARSRTALRPSVPTLLGSAAVVAAAAGAISIGSGSTDTAQAASHVERFPGPATVLTDDSEVSSSDPRSARERAVSRDSARMARGDAPDEKLLGATERQAVRRDAALERFAARVRTHAVEVARNTWHAPLTGYDLSSRFGECSYLWSACHTGLDFSAPSGTPIHAVATGVVTETGYDGAYGNKTVVRLSDGTEIWYCHQTSYTVSVGETVAGGQTIGYVGSTGNTTGPHLHLEVHPTTGAAAVDPYAALVAHGVQP